jgi:hypothetical protein
VPGGLAPESLLVTRYIGITPSTSSLADLLTGLRRELAAGLGQPAPESLADLSQLVNAVSVQLPFLELSAERPLILLVDALDQLGAKPQRVDWLPRTLAPHVRVVVSVLSDRPELADLRAWRPAPQVLDVGPLVR